jgi:hypothetical protein
MTGAWQSWGSYIPEVWLNQAVCGRSSVGRALASQAEGRGFETRRPLLRSQASIGRFPLNRAEIDNSSRCARLYQMDPSLTHFPGSIVALVV